jgi:hypothetical protein
MLQPILACLSVTKEKWFNNIDCWTALSLMFLQQFSGVNAIMFYTQTIFEKAGTQLDPGPATH